MAASRSRSPAERGRGGRKAVERVVARALLLRSVPVGEADLLVTLFTDERGLLSAAARGARRNTRRLGALEPMHELVVEIETREGSEVGRLVEARLERVRSRLTGSLARLEAAGQLLRWIRRACPPQIPEPSVYALATHALEALDGAGVVEPASELATFGVSLLDALGWGLDLEACVACGRACPLSSPASIDPTRGGLVCRACGGARRVLSSRTRLALLAARNEGAPLELADAGAAVDLVEATLEAHVAPRRPEGAGQPSSR